MSFIAKGVEQVLFFVTSTAEETRTLLYNLCRENNTGFGTKLSKPIVCTHSECRGRYCVVSHVNIGRSDALAYNSYRWRAIRLFNSLPKCIRICTTSCSVYGFKHTLDSYLMNIVDHPPLLRDQMVFPLLYYKTVQLN